MTYIATFFTHFAAVSFARLLKGTDMKPQFMPVPRKLSSSCGTCVRYQAEAPLLNLMDTDVEAVYEVIGREEYTCLMENK